MSASEQQKKRIRRDPLTTRAMILDATEKLMVDEGYASVSSRRIAQELGLNAATIHYYFPATDDVFVALHRRMMDRQVQEMERVLASDNPLVSFWELQSSGEQTALGVEFLALANHRKGLRDTLAAATDHSRDVTALAIGKVLGNLDTGTGKVPAIVLGTVLVAIGRLLANEERVGITSGHAEVREFVEAMLRTASPTSGNPGEQGDYRA